eukprot:739737-Pleurochrysis_carterae.AAC.3
MHHLHLRRSLFVSALRSQVAPIAYLCLPHQTCKLIFHVPRDVASNCTSITGIAHSSYLGYLPRRLTL